MGFSGSYEKGIRSKKCQLFCLEDEGECLDSYEVLKSGELYRRNMDCSRSKCADLNMKKGPLSRAEFSNDEINHD